MGKRGHGRHASETFKCAAGCGADVKVTVMKYPGRFTVPKNEQPYLTCAACRAKAAN